MTDRKPRINVTVDDDMNELLTALSKFEGKPKATLITDILEQMRPHLTDLLHAMELVEQKKDPSKVINKLLVNQQKQFLNSLEVSDD
jgi:predicted DNA-binding protein